MNQALESHRVRFVGVTPSLLAYRVRIRNSMIPNKSPNINHGITGSDEWCDVRNEGIKVKASMLLSTCSLMMVSPSSTHVPYGSILNEAAPAEFRFLHARALPLVGSVATEFVIKVRRSLLPQNDQSGFHPLRNGRSRSPA